ncbi:MAG TPA: hypothetical protein VGR11_05075 [Solirubrobacteraceae bacterium]|nr:hypothetical protein [Solirubrobacteraceae bacterium]
MTAVLALAAAGPAAAAPPTVVMYSDPGDYVGQGTARAYEGRNEVRVTGGRRELTISVEGAGGNFDVELTPPAGRVLRRGSYRGPSTARFARADGRASTSAATAAAATLWRARFSSGGWRRRQGACVVR